MTTTPSSKDNLIADRLETFRKIERTITGSEEEILRQRIEQGKALAELKEYTEAWSHR